MTALSFRRGPANGPSARRRASWMCLASSTPRASGTATRTATRGRGPSSVYATSPGAAPHPHPQWSLPLPPPPLLRGGGGDRGAKAHLRRFPAPCSAAVHDHRHDRARLYRHQHLRAAFSLYRRRARFRDDISSRGGVGVATYTRDRQRRAKRVNRGRRVAGICPTDSSVHPRGQKAHGVARPHVCRSASAVEGASGPASCPKQRAARWHKLNRDERALLCGPPLPTEPRTTPQSQSAGASFYRRKTAPSG